MRAGAYSVFVDCARHRDTVASVIPSMSLLLQADSLHRAVKVCVYFLWPTLLCFLVRKRGSEVCVWSQC